MLLMSFISKVKYVWGEPDPNDWWDTRAQMIAEGWGDPTEAWVEHLRDTGRFPPPVSFIVLDILLYIADLCPFQMSEEPEEAVPVCDRCRMPGPGVLSQGCVCVSLDLF